MSELQPLTAEAGDGGAPREPSVITAFSAAFDRAFDLLFPLDFRGWMIFSLAVWTAGLSAFLANAAGAFGSLGIFSATLPSLGMLAGNDATEGEGAVGFIQDNEFAHVFLVIWGGVFVCVMLLGLLCFFASARGKFILLRNVCTKEHEFTGNWDEYAPEANSLFRLYYACFFIVFLPGSLYVLWEWLSFVRSVTANAGIGELAWRFVLSSALKLVALLPLGLLVACFMALTNDFVIPIMYKKRCGWLAGWRLFYPVARAWPFAIAFYLVLRFVCFVVIQFCVQSIYGFLWCACCFPILPVANRAPFIPLDLFMRSFPVYLLQDMNPEWAILEPVSTRKAGGLLPSTTA